MFSNSTEWEIWSSNWCDQCWKDSPNVEGVGEFGCPIILAGMTGQPTPEWKRLGPDLSDIVCTEFEDFG